MTLVSNFLCLSAETGVAVGELVGMGDCGVGLPLFGGSLRPLRRENMNKVWGPFDEAAAGLVVIRLDNENC